MLQNSTPSSGLRVLLPLRSPCTAEPGGGRGWADLAFPHYFQKKTDGQIACSRLKDSAVESGGKNARRLEREGFQIGRILFSLGLFNYHDVSSIWKVGQANRQKDKQTDILFQYGVSSTFFLGLTKRRVSATPSDVNPDTEVLQINVNLFAFLCFRRNCPICRHPLFSQDSQ